MSSIVIFRRQEDVVHRAMSLLKARNLHISSGVLLSGFPWWFRDKRIHLLMQEMRARSLGKEDPLE